MLCCAVLLALVGFFIKRKSAPDPFPSPASWTATDEPLSAGRHTLSPPPTDESATSALILLWTAIGALVYVAAVTALLALGAADQLGRSELVWYLRDAFIAIVASTGIAIAVRTPTLRQSNRDRMALALVGGGMAWLVLGVVDQHVLMLFQVAHGKLFWDAIFHAAGVWAIAGGLLLLNRSSADRARHIPVRPARHQGNPA